MDQPWHHGIATAPSSVGLAGAATPTSARFRVRSRSSAETAKIERMVGGELQPPVALMAAVPVTDWPVGDGWLFEPKLDGWRLAAFRRPRRVVLQSRSGRDLTRFFPDITAAVARLQPGAVLDGEVVIWDGQRTDFTALQRRITMDVDPTAPASLVTFDLLQHPSCGVVLSLPLSARRELLIDVLADAPPAVALCPQSADIAVANGWLADWTSAGIEGVMVKAAASRYRLGARGHGWLKRRTTHTVDLLIGGVTGTLDRPETLLLGRRVGDRLSYVGRTTLLSDRDSASAAELFATLGLAEAPPTWPWPLPARWTGFHQIEPLEYVAVSPLATVEIVADRAFEHGRYRHPLRFVRIRADW
jgi:ATP-dependent DNA ligase